MNFWRGMKESRDFLKKNNCENCGIKDDVELFEYVLEGIFLCPDCADLPIKKIQKRALEWVVVDGERFPPDFLIAKKGLNE